jgi:ion channel-forming bestrophin family protein
VKHYLRGEDGLDHQDYAGLLPRSFARFDDAGYLTQSPSSIDIMSNSYATMGVDASRASTILERDNDSPHSDATKRVRVKRSNPNLKPASSSTPLLADSHTTVQFGDDASMPLPLMYGLFLSSAAGLRKSDIISLFLRIATEISRRLYHFRRDGFGETIGPAGEGECKTLYF